MRDTKLVVFDLDGTLVDTSPGIFATARYTAQKLGVNPDVPIERMRRFIGPPLAECFKIVYDFTDAQVEEAYPIYQERYRSHGQYMGKVYDGMCQVLDSLKARGYLLAVGTLKNESISLSLLSHFGILKWFVVVHGDVEKGGRSKADVLSLVLSDLHVEAGNSLMVGDSMLDHDGAFSLSIPFVAAAYGFGFPTRPQTGPSVLAVIDKPVDLLSLLC